MPWRPNISKQKMMIRNKIINGSFVDIYIYIYIYIMIDHIIDGSKFLQLYKL